MSKLFQLLQNPKWRIVTLVLIVLLGAFLRIYKFGQVPDGLNPNEAASTYESISLLSNGTDRWGNHFPVFFLADGTGQNVLLSYLNIPVFLLAGVTPVTVRFWPMLLGIFLIPLMFLLTRELSLNKQKSGSAAYIAAGIVAVAPLFVLQSRWAYDSNIMPFFLVSGVLLFIKALQKSGNWMFLFSMLALSLACYSSIIVLPVVLVISFAPGFLKLIKHRSIPKKLTSWLVLLIILLFPLLLFLVKNYLVITVLPFEGSLPFSIPLLANNTSTISLHGALSADWNLFRFGLDDRVGVNALQGFDALLPVFLLWPLFFIGLINNGKTNLKSNWGRILILLWTTSGLVLLGLLSTRYYLTTDQLGLVFPLIVLFVAFGTTSIVELVTKKLQIATKLPATLISIAVFLICALEISGLFAAYQYYFFDFNRNTSDYFYPGLSESLEAIKANAGEEPIYIDENIKLNYLYVLLSQKIAPQTFRNEAIIGNRTHVASINNFFLNTGSLSQTIDKVYYLTLKGTPDFCTNKIAEIRQNVYYLGSCNLK